MILNMDMTNDKGLRLLGYTDDSTAGDLFQIVDYIVTGYQWVNLGSALLGILPWMFNDDDDNDDGLHLHQLY
jgi:hypothetical protein